VSFYWTVGYKYVAVMDGVKFKFNDIKSLYMKNDLWAKKICHYYS